MERKNENNTYKIVNKNQKMTNNLGLPSKSEMEICIERTKLIFAIESGSVSSVQSILKNTNCCSELINSSFGPLRLTPLQLAATRAGQPNALNIVNLLIQHRAKAETADKIGRSPLHYAAMYGCGDMVKSLIHAGADVNCRYEVHSWPRLDNSVTLCAADSECYENKFTGYKLALPDCWGRTPLHEAVKRGHVECVQILVDNGANVNSEDEKSLIPLLLAGAGISSEDELAVLKYQQIVDILITNGSQVNVKTPDINSSPLFHAVALGSVHATGSLLEAGARLEQKLSDRKTRMETILHIAASTGCSQVIQLLLSHGAFKFVNCRNKVGCTPLHKAAYIGSRDSLTLLIDAGGDISACTDSGLTVVDVIVSYLPRSTPYLLDILDSRISANYASINDRDFKVFIDFHILAPRDSVQQMCVVNAIADIDNTQLLQHPLIEAFIRLKWAKLRAFFILLFSLHISFVISLSKYALVWAHHLSDEVTQLVWPRRVLIVSSSTLLLHSSIELFLMGRQRLRQVETWINLLCALLALIIAVAGELSTPGQEKPTWILHVASIDILAAWSCLMFLIGRFPTWGYYALMFSAVLQNVIKVLLTFVCLVIGFALSFAVQFPQSHQFADPWQALVKTTVMMTGEFDYGDLFTEDDRQRLVATSRLVFLLFVLLASVVLMNLMVGLAVSDIQGLQTVGNAKRLRKQADFVSHFERILSHTIVIRYFPRSLVSFLHSRRHISPAVTIQPSSLMERQAFPCSLLESVINIALQNRTDPSSKTQQTSRESKKIKHITRENIIIQENGKKPETKNGNKDDMAELIQLLQQVLATMNGKIKRNSLIPEDISEVDSSSVNALVRRISHTRY